MAVTRLPPTWDGRFLDSRPVSGYGTCFRGNDGLCKGLRVERGSSARTGGDAWPWIAAPYRSTGHAFAAMTVGMAGEE